VDQPAGGLGSLKNEFKTAYCMEEGFSLKKFQVTIRFEMDDEFMTLVPAHRIYINSLIENGIIDQYLVSMGSQRVWITLSAQNEVAVVEYLKKSPLHSYWTYEIDELFLVDGQHYRLPAVRLN
jgi:hypothetical protein